MSTYLSLEHRDSVAVIRLNRPEKLNALSRAMMLTLSQTFKDLEGKLDLRVVILTGAGRAFSAGTDITELARLVKDSAREVSASGQALCSQIENCKVPVIAAINGIAAGGGCELALASHIRIASANALFSFPEAKLGVIPGYGGTQRLTREIGAGRALEMILTSRTVGAEEAVQIGLINRIAAGDLLTETQLLAKEIATLAPLAIRSCLKAVLRGIEMPLTEGLALETKLFAALFGTDDVREGTRAFLEKRKPGFQGV